MNDNVPDGARTSPSTARNRRPILEVLRPRLPDRARVLEVASGAGEHAVFLSAGLPGVSWHPSDCDAEALASIEAWRAAAGPANLAPPIRLDAVVCINMVHISPWAASEGLMAGAARVLAPGGRLFLYGPYIEPGVATAPSNLAFDASLKSRDAAWGLRDLGDIRALAAAHGLAFAERIAMPANNLIAVFEKT